MICYYIKAFRTEADFPHVAHGLGGEGDAPGGNNKNEKGEHQMAVVSMKQLLEAGVHFGHQTRRWNPKMAEYF